MRRLFALLLLSFLIIRGTVPALAATSTQPSVKDVALAFGNAIVHNDGGTALSLLAPDLRRHTVANQLPMLLGVQAPPMSVSVVRWAYNNGLGDATLSMQYPHILVAEHLFLHLFTEGWRITAIVHEDAHILQHESEAPVVAFCEAAARQDVRAMRAQLTNRLSTHSDNGQVLGLLGLPSRLVSFTLLSYTGGPSYGSVTVRLHTASSAVTDSFAVVNNINGWRISGVQTVSSSQ